MTTAQETALKYGLLGFIVVWGIVLVPQVITHLAKYGRIDRRKLVVTATVILYACLGLAVVFLPLPTGGSSGLSQTVQLVPFQWIDDVKREAVTSGIPGGLSTLAFQQMAMNVLLFVPLGIFANTLWRKGATKTLLIGFGVSFAIEVTQVTANFGTAPFVYRIFDVDDLLNNTAGAVLGWVVAALASALRSTANTGAGHTVNSRNAVPAASATVPVPVSRPHRVPQAVPFDARHDAARLAGLRTQPLPRRP
ncbi:antibiotic resistance protein VanZ [Prauserella marina]|nr:VanZ family protein [Prauserella marina]ASR39834.1 antibiotic resistance protein VanZ [Prauserella marina]